METASAPPAQSHSRQSTHSHTDNIQTGIFLQQFTNSVNRALHKQTCTCNGRLYTADELLSKSNSALYATPSKSKTAPQVSKRRRLHLPPIDGLSLSQDSVIPLKNQLDREIIVTRPFKDRKLVTRSADGELRLPSIMDIRDTKGNNWKILQESGGRHGRRDKKPLQMIRQMLSENSYYNPHAINIPTDVTGNFTEDPMTEDVEGDQDQAAIESVFEANTPINSTCDPQEDAERHNELDLAIKADAAFELDDTEIEPLQPSEFDLAPVCTLAAQIRTSRPCCGNTPDGVYHDDFERKALLLKYSSEVRTRKTSYIEYLHKVSQMTLCPCLQLDFYRKSAHGKRRSDGEIGLELLSAKQRVLTAASRLTLKSRSLPAPDFASNIDTLSLYARGGNDHDNYSKELDKLYARDGYNIATLQIGGDEHLPKNFLERERQELRLLYPMYDWRVQYNQNVLTWQIKPSIMSGTSQEATPRQNGSVKKTSHSRKESRVSLLPSNTSDTFTGLGPKLQTEQQKISKKTSSDGQASGPEEMTKHSVTFTSTSLVRSDESLTKSRVLPKQPPTTPVEASVTLASASAPELLTIVESVENERKSEDVTVDDNNNEIIKEEISHEDNSGKSGDDVHEELGVEKVPSSASDSERCVNNIPDVPETKSENKLHETLKNKNNILLSYPEHNSIIQVTPASSTRTSTVNLADVANVSRSVSKEIRPSVQLLQIDTSVVSSGNYKRNERSVPQVVVNNNVDKLQKGHPVVSNKAPASHLRTEVARLATQKVVFVSPATTQA